MGQGWGMSEQQNTPGISVPEGEEILDRQESLADIVAASGTDAEEGMGMAEGAGVVDQQGALADELGDEQTES